MWMRANGCPLDRHTRQFEALKGYVET
jgi:hypothetical protein